MATETYNGIIMRILNSAAYINEKLDIKPITKTRLSGLSPYKYHPKTKDELIELVNVHIDMFGDECDLNDIDTSAITDMSSLFSSKYRFNGDISRWNVSNVVDMGW